MIFGLFLLGVLCVASVPQTTWAAEGGEGGESECKVDCGNSSEGSTPNCEVQQVSVLPDSSVDKTRQMAGDMLYTAVSCDDDYNESYNSSVQQHDPATVITNLSSMASDNISNFGSSSISAGVAAGNIGGSFDATYVKALLESSSTVATTTSVTSTPNSNAAYMECDINTGVCTPAEGASSGSGSTI